MGEDIKETNEDEEEFGVPKEIINESQERENVARNSARGSGYKG